MKKFEDIEFLAIEITKDNYTDIVDCLISKGYTIHDGLSIMEFKKNLKIRFENYYGNEKVYIYMNMEENGELCTGEFDKKTDLIISIDEVKSLVKIKERYRDIIKNHLTINNMGL